MISYAAINFVVLFDLGRKEFTSCFFFIVAIGMLPLVPYNVIQASSINQCDTGKFLHQLICVIQASSFIDWSVSHFKESLNSLIFVHCHLTVFWVSTGLLARIMEPSMALGFLPSQPFLQVMVSARYSGSLSHCHCPNGFWYNCSGQCLWGIFWGVQWLIGILVWLSGSLTVIAVVYTGCQPYKHNPRGCLDGAITHKE